MAGEAIESTPPQRECFYLGQACVASCPGIQRETGFVEGYENPAGMTALAPWGPISGGVKEVEWCGLVPAPHSVELYRFNQRVAK